MPSIRHYCDGHEYRYTERYENEASNEFYPGTLVNNYGRVVAMLTPLWTDKYLLSGAALHGGAGEITRIPAASLQDSCLASFHDRARFAIESYVAATPDHNS